MELSNIYFILDLLCLWRCFSFREFLVFSTVGQLGGNKLDRFPLSPHPAPDCRGYNGRNRHIVVMLHGSRGAAGSCVIGRGKTSVSPIGPIVGRGGDAHLHTCASFLVSFCTSGRQPFVPRYKYIRTYARDI